jgi:hypothetical protein
MTAVRESALGPSYWYHWRLIEHSKSWSADQISEYQALRFRRLIRRYGDAVTQKDDYRRNLRKYSRFDAPLLTHAVQTGGTSRQAELLYRCHAGRRQSLRAEHWNRASARAYCLSLDRHTTRFARKWLNLWILTAGCGLYLLSIWLIEYDKDFQSVAATRLPPPVLAGHVLVAGGGLLLWIAYLISDNDKLAWYSVMALVLPATLSLTMAIRWISV